MFGMMRSVGGMGGGAGGGVMAGSGPSQGSMMGGGFHSGTNQMMGGGLDTNSMTKWNNRELQGMAADPTGGMAHTGVGGMLGSIYRNF